MMALNRRQSVKRQAASLVAQRRGSCKHCKRPIFIMMHNALISRLNASSSRGDTLPYSSGITPAATLNSDKLGGL